MSKDGPIYFSDADIRAEREWHNEKARRRAAARRLHALHVVPWACAIDAYLATGRAVHLEKDGTPGKVPVRRVR